MSIRAKHRLIGSICLSVVVGCAGAPDRDAAVDAAPVDPPELGLEEFDPAVLGGCYRPDPDGTGPHTDGLAVLLEEIREWYRFPSGSLPDKEPPAEMNEWGDEPQAPIDLRGAESTAADPRSAAQVRERPRERMYVADSLGADVYLGYGISDQTDLAVAVHGPEVAFMSDCGHQAFTLPLDGYAASRGEDPATVFEAIVRGEITPREVTEWFNPGQEHPTDQAVGDDLAPEERHLDLVFPNERGRYRYPDYVSTRFSTYAQRFGLPHIGGPHGLRHSLASALDAHGNGLATSTRRCCSTITARATVTTRPAPRIL